MFEFNIAEAFTNVILDAISGSNENVKFGPKWTETKESINMVEIKITIDYNLVKFIAVGQSLNIFVGDNGEKKIDIKADDNEFDLAGKIIAALN